MALLFYLKLILFSFSDLLVLSNKVIDFFCMSVSTICNKVESLGMIPLLSTFYMSSLVGITYKFCYCMNIGKYYL